MQDVDINFLDSKNNILNYLKRNSKFGINYSERYEYIEFDNTLFVISDENKDIEDNI